MSSLKEKVVYDYETHNIVVNDGSTWIRDFLKRSRHRNNAGKHENLLLTLSFQLTPLSENKAKQHE
jgi:hypothetical protein